MFPVMGQGKKDQVLIYGESEACWAAAIQSSKSGVKTLWIADPRHIGTRFTGEGNVHITANKGLDAGLWADILQKVSREKALSDSVLNAAKRSLNPRLVQNSFSAFIDSTNNLTVRKDVQVKRIKKAGEQWRVYLSNNETIKVAAIVDGSDGADLAKLLDKDDLSDSYVDTVGHVPQEIYENTLYRSGLVVTEKKDRPSLIPAFAFLNTPASNFFIISRYGWLNKNLQNGPQDIGFFIQSGQALGAIAAYCAFFKTTTDKINIRMLQGELLANHGKLMPFQDIAIEDIHWAEIQRIGATGLLQGNYVQQGASVQFHFNPEKPVSSDEIKPIMLQLYTRSQLWFKDKQIENLTLKDLASLIKFTALKGDEIDAEMEKGWNKYFNFSGDYDPECYLTRRHVAVLIDYYLKPFNVKIDRNGIFRY